MTLLINSFLREALRCGVLVLFLGFAQAQTQRGIEYVEGEVIVTFKKTTTLRAAESVLRGRSMQFAKHFDRISSLRKRPMGMVKDRNKKTADLIQELKADPTVETVEPNYLRRVKARPNDARFNELWALENTGQTLNSTTGTTGVDIDYLQAWEKARPASGDIVVGLIDTGVDVIHTELAPRMWTNDLEIPNNNVDDDVNGYVDDVYGFDFVDNTPIVADSSDHGTHVSGTMVAQGSNALGVIGVHDQAQLMALKVSSDGDSISTSAVIAALEYALAMKNRGVPLVALNASYGGGGSSTAESEAIQALGEVGIILCAAAGNETADNDTTPSYPASYDLPNIIVVAATDQKDVLSSFSNFGTTVDLAAPGSNILSCEPSTVNVRVGTTNYSSRQIFFSGLTTSISGTVVDCGIGDVGQFPVGVSGNIALIARGTLTFAEKLTNARAAGAVAVLISNNATGLFNGTLGSSGDWLPARAISQADGQAIRAALPQAGSITATSGFQFLSGTSMATPMVTGAVAFAALNFPNETVAQRVQRIRASVDIIPALQGKVNTGGRLNLNRVVDANLDGVPDWETSALIIANAASLKGGAVGLPYAETLTTVTPASGLVFEVTSGTLPDGLTLNEGGELTGTPTTAGESRFTVTVTDAAENFGGRAFTLIIAAETVRILTAATLPEATTGAAYSVQLAGAGGTVPYLWNVSAGTLPAGLTLSSTGLISGAPDIAGMFSFTVRVVDAHLLTAELAVEVAVVQSLISISTPATLPYGVLREGYEQALQTTGGTEPLAWSIMSGALPPGLVLSTAGVVSGIPRGGGTFEFRARVQDAEAQATSLLFTLSILASFQVPTVTDFELGSTTVGASYTAVLSASDYPQSFTVRGLPSGLIYAATSGIISGRARESGDFPVQVTAKNSAGQSLQKSAVLTVLPVAGNHIGNFVGLAQRHAEVNGNVGSRLTLTTTSLGSYTLKLTTGTRSHTVRGYLTADAPQVLVEVAEQTLSLTLDADTQEMTGTHGTATVNGWRSPWHSRDTPATDYAGYYSAGLTLSDGADEGVITLPQGTGFISLRVSTAGLASIVGRTATGERLTSAGLMAADGQAALYQSLYHQGGSLFGRIIITRAETDAPLLNELSGASSWLKPSDASRAYGPGFDPLVLRASGGFLALKSTGSTVRGLPLPGTASLIFADGGLALAAQNPDVASFDYSSRYIVKMPTSGTDENPARATLSLNKATGLISGSFTLAESSPVLKRTAKYLGIIVPQSTELPEAEQAVKAQGYFTLPQIPLDGESSRTVPILSGGVQIRQ